MDPTEIQRKGGVVLDAVGEAVIIDRTVLETLLIGLMADGHVLLEDVPGTGKTLTARSFATAIGCSFNRIQFTPDLLPTDVTGSHIFNEQTREFEFTRGPVFANVVLADEINRASPKTQAALLEAMEERQVTADGDTYRLPSPFLVIATQNPIEMEGTFELPEAQKDRFMMKTSLGYPDRDGELELLARRLDRRQQRPTVDPVCDESMLSQLRRAPEEVVVDETVRHYLTDLVRQTREDPRVASGVSPRGTQRFLEAVRARATIQGRSYAINDDVKSLAERVLAHRLVLTTDARVDGLDGRSIIQSVLDTVTVPHLNEATLQ